MESTNGTATHNTLQQEVRLEVVAADAGARLDVYLANKIPWLSRNRIQQLIESGAVQTSRPCPRCKDRVEAGELITLVVPPPKASTLEPQDIPLDIIYEDDDLLVINKQAGLPVHPGAGNPDGTLVNALLSKIGNLSSIGGVERPGIVHRLDKDTSGLLLVAKNDVAHRSLSEALARREIHRVYWALVLRNPTANSGTIRASVARHPAIRTKMAVVRNAGKEAVTHWRVLERFHGFSLIEYSLETGRTHQIRVHTASIGHPVLGDTAYGGSVARAAQLIPPRKQELLHSIRAVTRQLLHAKEISFVHPRTHQEMHFSSPLPEDFQKALDALRIHGKDA